MCLRGSVLFFKSGQTAPLPDAIVFDLQRWVRYSSRIRAHTDNYYWTSAIFGGPGPELFLLRVHETASRLTFLIPAMVRFYSDGSSICASINLFSLTIFNVYVHVCELIVKFLRRVVLHECVRKEPWTTCSTDFLLRSILLIRDHCGRTDEQNKHDMDSRANEQDKD